MLKMLKCTSPCNPSGCSVIFVEIPAFNHSDSTMQKKIPVDGLTEFITFFHHTHPWNANWKISYTLAQTYSLAVPKDLSTLVSSTCILWLHKKRTRFNKYLDRLINLCHACGYKPTSVLLPGGARLGGMTVVRMLGRQRCTKRRWHWRNIFKWVQVLRYT